MDIRMDMRRGRTTANLKEIIIPYSHNFFPPIPLFHQPGFLQSSIPTHLFTTMAPSSIMHPEPITMGPAIAKIVAFGCTMVPTNKHNVSQYSMGKDGV